MTRFYRRLRPVGLVAVALLAGSCDQASAPRDLPLSPSFSQQSGFKLVKEKLPRHVGLEASQLIGLSGGSVSLLGHTLTVPAGAVTVPTLFTMTVLPSAHIDVELSATVTDLLGRIIDVGQSGFSIPITLSLTYSRATNVNDPADLFLVYINGSTLTRLPSTVDQATQTVSTQLNHFSAYGMCTD